MNKKSKKNNTKRKRNTKKKRNTKNKKMMKGGQVNEIENYKLRISEIGKQCIENIQLIQGIPHLPIINGELDKIKNFLEEMLLKEIYSMSISTNEELYSYIESIYQRKELKLYHFNYYTKYSTSSLLFINILENEISLMKKMIDLVNHSNYISESPEIKTIKERYENVCNEFASQLPCLEQFVTTVYPRVIKPLEEVVEKYNNKIVNNNVNNVKEIMNINDFHYDGDFNEHSDPTYDLPNYILLSLLSFRKSLCNNDKNNTELITESYNENNYKQYLEFIHFFNNENYKTIGIDWNELKKIFHSYQLDLPNTKDFLNENMCCLDELNDRQQQIVGGKKHIIKN